MFLLFFAAVINYLDRSSLSVAGLLAADRFGITAAQLSFFTTLQLLVYAAMQVPAGLAIDRFGPRRALIAGITVLTLAQVGFALALTYPAAIIARVFIGGGDALNWSGSPTAGFSSDAKDWDNQTYYTTTFGQAFTVTPTQVLSVFQTIANGGVRLPASLVGGGSCCQVAAWRGAFLAHGSLTEPGRSMALEVTCPGSESALALVGAARRL